MIYNKYIKKKGRISNPLFTAVNVLANTVRWLSFFKKILFERERTSGMGKGQRDKQTPCSVGSPTQGLIPGP